MRFYEGWLGQRSTTEVMEQLIPAGGVVGPVYDAAQIAEDPSLPGAGGYSGNRRPGIGEDQDVGHRAQVQ